MLEQIFALAFLAATVRLSIPYILAALGGVSSERSGVVNIALEGIMIVGAFAAAAVTYATGNAWAGLAAAVGAGMLTGALHALATITFRADQIISGLAVNLLAAGATKFGAKLLWHKPQSDPIAHLPWLWTPPKDAGAAISFVHMLTGEPMILLTIVLIVVFYLFHTRTAGGLRMRAVGEAPHAAASLGVSVVAWRYIGVLISGALAALGGAWLAFDVSQFADRMSAGKGYIAMAAVVFGKWHPIGATVGCLVFGASGALAEALERSGAKVPSELIGTLPYVLTIIALVGLVGRARPPKALGVPFVKEQA